MSDHFELSAVAMLLAAPLVGVGPDVAGQIVLHGVPMEGIALSPGRDVPSTAACGVACYILGLPLPAPTEIVPWPVFAKLPPPFVRCRPCWVATGKKRPRSKLERPPDYEEGDRGEAE